MKNTLITCFLLLSALVSTRTYSQGCPNNHLFNYNFSAGLSGWAQYGAVNGQVLPIQMGCIDTCLVLQATNNSTSGVVQQVVIHKDTCYDLCYCIASPNNNVNTRVLVALITPSVTVSQLLTGSFTPSQAQILDSYIITSAFAPTIRCPGTFKATGNFTGFVILNQTIGNIGTDIRIDNICLQSRVPCPPSSCDSTQAAFSYTANGTSVQFLDNSVSNYPVTGWSWNFGDPASGANDTSTLQNPVHIFSAPGWYLVCLVVTAGIPGVIPCQDTICMDVYVPASAPCDSTQANFSYLASGLSVQFTDLSVSSSSYPVSAWLWNFGDPPSGANNTSNLQNPLHTFSGPGWYLVCLYITAGSSATGFCYDTLCMDVFVPATLPCDSVVANFTYSTSGLTANFTDVSTLPSGATVSSWAWDFGDPPSGINNTSILQNPSHTYTTAGWYVVCLYLNVILIDGTPCSDTICKDVYISGNGNLCDSLNPSFSSSGAMTVNFTDMTTVGGGMIITSWNWNFGDPASGTFNYSNLQNPSHTFTQSGSYLVCLVVTANIPGTTFICTDSICMDLVVSQHTGMNLPSAGQILLVPNPTKGAFRILSEGLTVNRIMIFDAIGRVVLDQPYSHATVDLPDYCNPGLYTVRLETSQGVKTLKLLVNR